MSFLKVTARFVLVVSCFLIVPLNVSAQTVNPADAVGQMQGKLADFCLDVDVQGLEGLGGSMGDLGGLGGILDGLRGFDFDQLRNLLGSLSNIRSQINIDGIRAALDQLRGLQGDLSGLIDIGQNGLPELPTPQSCFDDLGFSDFFDQLQIDPGAFQDCFGDFQMPGGGFDFSGCMPQMDGGGFDSIGSCMGGLFDGLDFGGFGGDLSMPDLQDCLGTGEEYDLGGLLDMIGGLEGVIGGGLGAVTDLIGNLEGLEGLASGVLGGIGNLEGMIGPLLGAFDGLSGLFGQFGEVLDLDALASLRGIESMCGSQELLTCGSTSALTTRIRTLRRKVRKNRRKIRHLKSIM